MHVPLVRWDYLLLVGLLMAILLWHWQYPHLVRADAAGSKNARLRYYPLEIVPLWALALGVIALWLTTGRPWGALLLGPSAPWRLALGFALAGAYVWLTLSQRRAVLARPEILLKLVKTLGEVQPLLPRTGAERRGFATLSITAGICEELLFRGFVLWCATKWTGPVGGFLISSLSFGLMHIYLGPRNLPKAAIAGIVFYIMAMTSGSLVPAMICHCVADLVSGDLGYRALGADSSSGTAEGSKQASASA